MTVTWWHEVLPSVLFLLLVGAGLGARAQRDWPRFTRLSLAYLCWLAAILSVVPNYRQLVANYRQTLTTTEFVALIIAVVVAVRFAGRRRRGR